MRNHGLLVAGGTETSIVCEAKRVSYYKPFRSDSLIERLITKCPG